MSEEDDPEFWVKLQNNRGIAGAAARTNKTKLNNEKSYLNVFVNAVHLLSSIEIYDLKVEEPPLPDFSIHTSGKKLAVELTEFIDSKVIKDAKKIKKDPNNPLNDFNISGGLWFETNKDWFHSLLWETISKKEEKYENREIKIDVLLIFNEALQVGIEDTDQWLQEFNLPVLKNISSIYFLSWYHPNYLARPLWSIKAHPLIGEIKPVLADH